MDRSFLHSSSQQDAGLEDCAVVFRVSAPIIWVRAGVVSHPLSLPALMLEDQPARFFEMVIL